jgi:hypothetical protein
MSVRGRVFCGLWRHDGVHGFRSFRALARSAVSVTRGTTSHGEAEMAKVSDYGNFDFGYAK